MSKYNLKAKAIIIFSVALMLFSCAFGFTWSKHGFCLGDSVLKTLGLSAWSNGTSGTHYTAIFALVLFLIAFFLFIGTTRKSADHTKTRT